MMLYLMPTKHIHSGMTAGRDMVQQSAKTD